MVLHILNIHVHVFSPSSFSFLTGHLHQAEEAGSQYVACCELSSFIYMPCMYGRKMAKSSYPFGHSAFT